MITKRNLSPVQVLRYTAGPAGWALAWAIAVPVLFAITGASWLPVPFAPIGALGAALAIFIAFRGQHRLRPLERGTQRLAGRSGGEPGVLPADTRRGGQRDRDRNGPGAGQP